MTIFGRQHCVPSSPVRSAKLKTRRQESQRRALFAEALEERVVMDSAGLNLVRYPFWNIHNSSDVNADGRVSAFDAITIISDLNIRGARSLATGGVATGSGGEAGQGPSAQFVDVNNDNRVTAMDALQVINRLNSSAGEGEMIKLTVQIVAAGTNTDITEINKGGFYEVRILTEDLGILSYMGQNRPSTTSTVPPETLLGVATSFFDLEYNRSKTDFQVNEVQNILITNGTTNGNFTLTINDGGTLRTTGNIVYAGNRDTANSNIQEALDALLGNNVVEVTRAGGNNFRVRFINRLSDQDLPPIVGNNVSLGGTASFTVSEVIRGLPSDSAAIADALRLRQFFDTDGNPLVVSDDNGNVFFQDQRVGSPAAFGLNDVGGSHFLAPYQGMAPTEIVRLRMTANDSGIVPINISLANVLGGLETGVQGFGVAVTTDLIIITNDSIEIKEPLSAGDDTATTTEGSTTPIDIVVTTNDVNVAPTPNTAKTVQSVNTTGTLGTVSIQTASTVRYTPPGSDINGIDSFTYTVTDQNGNTDTATVRVTINPVNDAPVITIPGPQNFNEDTSRVFSAVNGNQILLNDVDDPTGDMELTVQAAGASFTFGGTVGLTFTLDTPETKIVRGTLSALNTALNGLTYTPNSNASGSFTLGLFLNDLGQTGGPQATDFENVTLNVAPVNDAPVVQLGGYTIVPEVVEGDPLVLNAANNTLIQVSDVDSSNLTVTLAVATGNTLQVNPAGVTVGGNNSNSVTISGTVANVNAALAAGVTFTAALGAATPETLQITVNDGVAAPVTSSKSIDVIPATRPRARNDVKTVTEDSVAGLANTVDVLDNDIVNLPDPTVYVAELLSFELSINGGTITRDDNGTPADFSDDQLIYVPAANFFGTDTFGYTMTDTKAGSTPATGTVTVTVTAVNDTPVPANDTLSNVAEDSAARTILASDLIGNDSRGAANESAQTLTIAAVSGAVGGTVSINGSGNVVFTPTANFNGPASFTYTVTDNGQTNGVNDFKTSVTSATASFTITEVNDAPTISNISIPNIVEDSGTYFIPFAGILVIASPGPANESGQTLTLNAVSSPNGGTVAIVGSNIEFTPAPNFNDVSGQRFFFDIFDNGTTNGAPDPLNVIKSIIFAITPVNDAPTVVDDGVTISEGQIIDINVTGNDRDVDINPPTGTAGQLQGGPRGTPGPGTLVSIVTNANPAEGTASVNANGTIKFTPALGFFGTTSFTYQLDDQNSPNPVSAPATVTVTVVELNEAPEVTNDSATLAEDSVSFPIDVLANDTDSDTPKANWSFILVSGPSNGDVVFNTTTRVVEYTPDPDFNGADSFVYRVNDNSTIAPEDQDSTTDAIVTINVTPVNDAPVGGVDPATGEYTVIMDRDRTFTTAELLVNDSPGSPANESGQSISITAVNALSDEGGTVTLSGGVITYTPDVGFLGSDFFEYTLTDNGTTNGAADPKSVQVRVNIIVRDFIPTDINGFVYRDVNSNGVYDLGVDYPLADADVTLSGTSEVTGAITPVTVTTDYLGFYEFLAVEPGDYILTESQPLGLSDGQETLGQAASFFANDKIALDLPLLGLTGGISRNDFGEGAVNANALINSAGLAAELDASSSRNGFVLATTMAGDAYWSWALKNWSGAAGINVILDADKTAATMEVTDIFGAVHTKRIYVNPYDTRNPERANPDLNIRLARFRILGWDAAGNHIIRIDGKATDFFGAATPLAAAPAPAMSAGEYVEGVEAVMAEESWA